MADQDSYGPLRSLVQFAEHSDQVIFSYDIDNSCFGYLNPAFEQVWQKSISSLEANATEILASIHPSDREYLQLEYRKIINREPLKDLDFRIILPDKQVRWLRLNASLEGNLITGSAEDITSKREKDEYAKKFTAKKNSILEILAHDLAGPLNNINLASTFIAEKSKAYQDTELLEMINIIKRTSERSVQLIHDFVQQEFLEATTVEVIKKRVDIILHLKEIAEEYQTAEHRTNIAFTFNSSLEQLYMDVDDLRFRQVINNLISNSLKFTPNGGTISLGIEERQETVLLTLADTGIGIPSRFHDELFEKFTKARRKGLRGEASIGLGMSIIKTIIAWHGGKIWFESEENKGTTFYIELPKN